MRQVAGQLIEDIMRQVAGQLIEDIMRQVAGQLIATSFIFYYKNIYFK